MTTEKDEKTYGEGPATQVMYDIAALRRAGEWMDRVTAKAVADTYGFSSAGVPEPAALTLSTTHLWRRSKHNKAK